MENWKLLCGLSVELCGSQKAFKREANVLRRLVKQYGAHEVEKMIRGAMTLGWSSLISLGSAEGSGRRKAIEAYWREQKREPAAQSLKEILRKMSL